MTIQDDHLLHRPKSVTIAVNAFWTLLTVIVFLISQQQLEACNWSIPTIVNSIIKIKPESAIGWTVGAVIVTILCCLNLKIREGKRWARDLLLGILVFVMVYDLPVLPLMLSRTFHSPLQYLPVFLGLLVIFQLIPAAFLYLLFQKKSNDWFDTSEK